MWTALVIAALALANGAHGYNVDVVVPASPAYGSTVNLEANYQMGPGEYIQDMTWTKDGQVFMTYSQRPDNVFSWRTLRGVDINRDASSPSLVVLNNVDDSASGSYGVSMIIASGSVGSISTSTYNYAQDMLVGGGNALGERFNSRRPGGGSVGGTTTTIVQHSSSAGSGPAVDPLGSRFGGGAAAAPAAPAAAAVPAAGLANAIEQLQNAQNKLANALNAALG
ncbi:uncharacterized protein LOC119091292 [Pollicipes pollicipes]|uniref:uncharacterized protein LOC119091292 n=1 Tax=Pollicipes pollicipes TaxID=41117 RepID=UPI0018858EFA|nr:uncharacterized protein LOC119091292 [Pollicipes pollicipes]